MVFARSNVISKVVKTLTMSTANGIVFVMGPTATGKTELALRLHEQLDSEIVSVDSAMVYRTMDIGTAKPDRAVLNGVPHHLIDICDPIEPYSAARFQQDASAAINSILTKGKTAILVGGTGLYFRALEQGLADLPDANYRIRACLEQQGRKLGWPAMHAKLADIDPASAARINENDPQRIQRALEVYEITGKSMSELMAAGRTRGLTRKPCKLLLMPRERSELHARIKNRFMAMLDAGLVDEVRALYERGDLSLDMPSMRLVGYRQVWRYLAGETDYDTMVEHAVVATRQLAKRQMTWFKQESDVKCYDPLENGIIDTILTQMD